MNFMETYFKPFQNASNRKNHYAHKISENQFWKETKTLLGEELFNNTKQKGHARTRHWVVPTLQELRRAIATKLKSKKLFKKRIDDGSIQY